SPNAAMTARASFAPKGRFASANASACAGLTHSSVQPGSLMRIELCWRQCRTAPVRSRAASEPELRPLGVQSPVGPMRRSPLPWLLLGVSLGSCQVDVAISDGKECDADHACTVAGHSCVLGHCVP